MRTSLNTYTKENWEKSATVGAAGEEFDWFARDKHGQLAVFTSACAGPIPASIWGHLREYNALVTRIESLPSSEFIQMHHGSGNYEDWQDFASVGFFAFDYHDVHRVVKRRGYDLYVRPTSPIQYSAIEPEFVAWIPMMDVSFHEISFVADELVLRSICGVP